MDFRSAIDFLVSLDKARLEDEGPSYLQNVKLDKLVTHKYEYDDVNSDIVSDESSFDMFQASLISMADDELRATAINPNSLIKKFSKESIGRIRR